MNDAAESRLPRWVLPPLWAAGFALVHCLVPWGIAHLSIQHGWRDGAPGQANLLALAGVAVGVAGFCWTAATHLRQIPAEGTALQWDTSYVITRGPYAFSRHPMYLFEQVTWVGWALFFGSVGVLVALTVMWAAQNVLAWREEVVLAARFGEPYREYARRVSRWLGRTRPPA